MPVYTYGKELKDTNGNIILPHTKAKFVYMSNNATAEDILGNYATKIQKDQDLSPELSVGYNRLTYPYRNGQWGSLQHGLGGSFNNSENKIGMIIKLNQSNDYSITRVHVSSKLRGPAYASLSLSKKKMPMWPPNNPDALTTDSSMASYNTPVTSQSYEKDFNISIDNSIETGNSCLYLEFQNNGVACEVDVTVYGTKKVEDPIVMSSEFFKQVNTNENVNGYTNPYSGYSLEHAIMHIKGEIDNLKK